MSVRRVMGIETELGITSTQVDQRGEPLTPMVLSGQVVRAYAAGAGPTAALPTGSGWDYADETPLRDARGYEMARALAHVSQLTDTFDPTIANSVLSNGARFYVDHAHPEYSSPEVTSPREAVRYDRAGELVGLAAVRTLAEQGRAVSLYKNNVDGKGASYGTHENYLVPRTVPFDRLAAQLIPFLVARPVIAGAGRVGLGQVSERSGFQLSQRADYLEAEVGLETTLRRPIVNTRDEPHATPHVHRRLHVIVGDATMADVTTLLALGSLSAVLRLVETHPGWVPDVRLADPVTAVKQISHDPSLRTTVPLTDGRDLTGPDLLESYLEAVERAAASGHEAWEPDADTTEVLTRWRSVLDALRRDPAECAAQVEWVAKLVLLERFRERTGAGWDDPRLAAMDIQWHDLDPARGLAQKLRAAGRLERLVPVDEVASAVTDPPEDTRAWFRGECVRRFGGDVRAASWDSVVLLDERGKLRRVQVPEPTAATRERISGLLARHTTTASLLTELASEDV
ncbi:depupylase/deamidase Dop [Ornithinimicrobium humiphilum]|uniref:Proteasome accessory factor A n=1 Tax=Ornithinimicrobium humiphilum TaxID=125288 RepID=A0A543KP71_9MICO|nr:depupylase/deamidase Dop [Ornithinimicrobium humiphilum]TQM96875.1 proteasome accessory factor A [Ornithinimicrobium humiphilum]